MARDDRGRPVLDYHPPGGPDDVPEQRFQAVVFVVGILLLVIVGMGVVVRFVIGSMLG